MRKLAQNRLEQFNRDYSAQKKQLDKENGTLVELRKEVDRDSLRNARLLEKFTETTRAAKGSLLGLASLIEESAFSTRYDIMQTKILQKNNPSVSTFTAGETDGATKP